MNYDISATLAFLPQTALVILTVALIFLEVRTYLEYRTEGNTPGPDPVHSGFLPPPGDGYEHYIDSYTVVYLLKRGRNRYRVYLVKGQDPNAKVRRDKYGRYFKIHAPDPAAAERIAENAFA